MCSHQVPHSQCVPLTFPCVLKSVPNLFPSHSHVFWNLFPMHHTSKNSTPITYLLHSHYTSRYTHTYVMSARDGPHISPTFEVYPIYIVIAITWLYWALPLQGQGLCIPNSCKALLKNTPYIRDKYKGIKLRIREKWHEIKLVQSSCENFSVYITDHLCRLAIFICQSWRLATDWSWWWEVCFETVEVRKWLILHLPPNLRWKMLASFVMWLKLFNEERWPR
jgi:hypothetical protein